MRTKLFCLVLLSLLLPVLAPAQYIFTTNNGTITITQYTGTGGAVTIPNTTNGLKITTIGTTAFFQTAGLTSITMGTNLTTIGTNAIFQCPNLSAITFSGSVTNIGDGPFIDCKSLTTISLSSSNGFYAVTNNALYNKTLTSLIEYPGGLGGSYTISQIVTNTGEAFIGNSLSSIVVNSTNTHYSSTNGVLFDKSQTVLISYPGTAPGSYTVPSTVSLIVSASFEYSTGVTAVSIGTNVTSIGSLAFYDCSSLTSIAVNSTNAFFSTTNGVLFDRNKTLLIQYPSGLAGSYVMPNTVTNVGDGAFGDAFGLTSIVFADGVTNVGFEAFYSDIGLTSVTLGTHLRTIGQAAFISCIALKSVVFPTTLTSIGFEAFAGCQTLTNACFEGNQPIDGGSIFFADPVLTTILYVNGTTGWGAFYDNIMTAPCLTCGGAAPELLIIPTGANVVLAWPNTFTGYTLQSTTNIVTHPVWTTVTPAPVVLGNYFVVTNASSLTRRFYRLMGP